MKLMNFIIEADSNNVSLLFRRPKKEQLNKGPNNLVEYVSTSTVPNNTNSSSARIVSYNHQRSYF